MADSSMARPVHSNPSPPTPQAHPPPHFQSLPTAGTSTPLPVCILFESHDLDNLI